MHALDLCMHINHSPIVSGSAAVKMDGERYIMNAKVIHETGQCTFFKLGNLTDKFSIALKAIAVDKTISMPDLLNVYNVNTSTNDVLSHTSSSANTNLVGDKTGHIQSLNTFFNAVTNNRLSLPNLTDAKNAALLSELFLVSLENRSKEIVFDYKVSKK